MNVPGRRDDASAAGTDASRIRDVCAQLLAELAADGASIAVRGGPGVAELVHVTDDVSATLEELQLVLGEGPAHLAYDTTAVVLAADINANSALTQWPGFAPEAARTGAAALLALPLQIDSSTFGHVQLHRTSPGPIVVTDRAHDLVRTLAEVVVAAFEMGRATRPVLPLSSRPDLHVAAGIVSVHLNLPVRHAMARICAAAFSEQRPVQDVAHDIVTGRRSFRLEDPD